MTEFVMILSTAPAGAAEKIAMALVGERLAACVNVSQVKSYYAWEGKLAEASEELMIIKTVQEMVEPLKKRIKELHSYELPEIIVIPVKEGDEAYLRWISENTG